MELTISYSQLMIMNYDGQQPYEIGLLKILKEAMLRWMELLFLKRVSTVIAYLKMKMSWQCF